MAQRLEQKKGSFNLSKVGFSSYSKSDDQNTQKHFRDQFGILTLTLGLAYSGYNQLSYAEEQDKSNND